MSKGIAIRTILTLLLGVLVVGILVYMVYTYATGPGLDMEGCRSRVVNWCTGCKIAGWSRTIPAGDDIKTCIPKFFGGPEGDYECDTIPDGSSTQDFCASFLGGGISLECTAHADCCAVCGAAADETVTCQADNTCDCNGAAHTC